MKARNFIVYSYIVCIESLSDCMLLPICFLYQCVLMYGAMIQLDNYVTLMEDKSFEFSCKLES